MHVDDFISNSLDDTSDGERYARWVLMFFRLKSTLKYDFGEFMQNHKLFCTFEGNTYRVTGASRLGDIWLHSDFSRDIGYEKRVDLEKCSDWRKHPDVCEDGIRDSVTIFNGSYLKACNSSQPADWHQTALLARQLVCSLVDAGIIEDTGYKPLSS